uniref:Uncharacterized protein n=1 Tax=Oncorhynchus kisutch TaxID=8019 RepID=A0A8C7D2R5_ONCKI
HVSKLPFYLHVPKLQYHTEKCSTMPDSPADVKAQSRLTPTTMPPPPPTTQGAPRTSSFTPTTCKY